MRLSFRRSSRSSSALPIDWAFGLATIGHALDAFGSKVSDIAISVTGTDARVIVLVWHRYRKTGGLVNEQLQFSLSEPRVAKGSTPSDTGWTRQLRILGQSFNQVKEGVRDPLILAIEGGFSVTSRSGCPGNWSLVSWEVETT